MQHDAPYWVGWVFGVVGGGLAVGTVLGLIPLILGQSIAQVKLGRVGFFCTLGGGFIGGVFLALPVALGFVVALAVRWRRAKSVIAGAVGPDA
jgi:uncharacterized membrane protein